MGSSYQGLFENWEIAIAKKLCSEFLAGHSWLKGFNLDDLVQECLIHWYLVRGSYRPDRGASARTYMSKVIRRMLLNLLEEQLTDKRKAEHLAIPLDRPIEEGGLSLGDTTPADIIPPEADVSLRMDLGKALDKLTPLQRKLCDLLEQGYTVTEIGRILGKSRGAVYDDIKRVRKIFSDEGLEEYLG